MVYDEKYYGIIELIKIYIKYELYENAKFFCHYLLEKNNDDKTMIFAIENILSLENKINIKKEICKKYKKNFYIKLILQKILNEIENISNIGEKIHDFCNCNICYSEQNNFVMIQCCKSKLCLDCIYNIFNNNNLKCPFCRYNFKFDFGDLNKYFVNNFNPEHELNHNFINGVYYQDEINSDMDNQLDYDSDNN